MQINNEQLEKVLDKVRKLLALSQSANEHEAALAAEKAQALLAEYNLSLKDVEAKEQHSEYTQDAVDTGHITWIRITMAGCAELYFCGYYFMKWRVPGTKGSMKDRHYFVGEKHNIIVAELMGAYLVSTIRRLSLEGSKTQFIDQSDIFKYRQSFCLACASRLRARIAERIQKSKQGGVQVEGRNLPALLSLYDQAQQRSLEFLEQQGIKLRNVPTKSWYSHNKGASDGRAAADTISLDSQVGRAKAVAQIGR